MKHVLIILLQVLFTWNGFSQISPGDPVSKVSLDTLVKTVRELSGEDSTEIIGSKTIVSERASPTGRKAAADYIFQKLGKYDLDVSNQEYRIAEEDAEGRNVLAIQSGAVFPDSLIIVCAHFDAETEYCADDNASGAAAVLEAARILSKYRFEFTIVYAFWDQEETGRIGSRYYAARAKADGQKIAGVINLDMLGYDGDSDHVFDIYAYNTPGSLRLRDGISNTIDAYGLSLNPNVMIPSPPTTDHVSFHDEGFAAIAFGESFHGGDPNPAFHTPEDRIHLFNLPYYRELTRLLVGLTSMVALPHESVALARTIDTHSKGVLSVLPTMTPSRAFVHFRGNKEAEWAVANGVATGRIRTVKNLLGMDRFDYSRGFYFLMIQDR